MEIPNDPFVYVMNMRTDSLVDNIAAQSLVNVENGNDIISSLTALVDKGEIQEKYDFILNEIHNNISFIPISYTKELVIFKSDKIMDYEFNGQPLNMDISGVEMK